MACIVIGCGWCALGAGWLLCFLAIKPVGTYPYDPEHRKTMRPFFFWYCQLHCELSHDNYTLRTKVSDPNANGWSTIGIEPPDHWSNWHIAELKRLYYCCLNKTQRLEQVIAKFNYLFYEKNSQQICVTSSVPKKKLMFSFCRMSSYLKINQNYGYNYQPLWHQKFRWMMNLRPCLVELLWDCPPA